LRKFDETGPQFFKGHSKALGVGEMPFRRREPPKGPHPFAKRNVFLELELLYHTAEAVLDKDADDLPEALGASVRLTEGK